MTSPIGKDLLHFVDPALDDVGCIPSARLREFKEPRPWLHIARFVHDNHRQETAALLIFLGRDFSEKVRQPRIIRLKSDASDLTHEVRIRDHSSSPCAIDHDLTCFILRSVPVRLSKPVIKALAQHGHTLNTFITSSPR